MRLSRGFSLVECLVGAVLLAAGLLAIAASSRATQRLSLLGERIAGAADVAASRLAELSSAPCSAAGGTATLAPFDTQWSVGGGAPVRAVTMDVRFVHDGRLRAMHYDAVLLCLAP